jgi:hypothetical protein
MYFLKLSNYRHILPGNRKIFILVALSNIYAGVPHFLSKKKQKVFILT